jgi:Uma2 family endonuclease
MTPLTLDPPMRVLVTDPTLARELREKRERQCPETRDEVWEGVLVMAPLANNEHQAFVMALAFAFNSVVNRDGGDLVLPGANVSDRVADWLTNYRIPDVVVYLARNPARNLNTHWVGGPDLAVEITSPGENPREKLDFYAKVNTREVLIFDRDPWSLELYRLREGRLISAGRSDEANQTVLASEVLPLRFQLRPGTPRPTIQVAHTASPQTWTA